MNKSLLKELMELTPEERIQLAEDLWDSIAAEEMPPPSEEQIEEMERRLAEHESDPSSALSWDEVREWLWSRYK